MKDEDIEIQLIHTKAMEKDNDFGIRILINDEDVSPFELTKEDILHIVGILLNSFLPKKVD
jgi:hypothetical protein